MTDDLVKALREFADDGYPELSIAAADRIEQLERELSISRMAQVVMDNGAEVLMAERDKYEAAWMTAEGKLADADAMIEAQAKDHASNNIRFAEATHRAEAAEADNARMVEALEFYADLSRDGPWNLPAEDYGKIARAALNTGKEVTPNERPVRDRSSDIGPGDQAVAGAALRDRAIDLSEEFDTMMDVQANPCGAWMAIQEMASVIVAAKEPSQ